MQAAQPGAAAGPVLGVLAEHAAALGVSLASGEPLRGQPTAETDKFPAPAMAVKGQYRSPLLNFRSYRCVSNHYPFANLLYPEGLQS